MNGNSNENRKMTIAEKYGYEEERLTYQEVLALERETDELKPLKIGKYGRMWATYMTEEQPARKAFLLTEGIWNQTMAEVQDEAMTMLIGLQEQYKAKNPRPTEYQAILHYESQMRDWAEEVMLAQIVYKVR